MDIQTCTLFFTDIIGVCLLPVVYGGLSKDYSVSPPLWLSLVAHWQITANLSRCVYVSTTTVDIGLRAALATECVAERTLWLLLGMD